MIIMFKEKYNEMYDKVHPGDELLDKVRKNGETPVRYKQRINTKKILIAAVIAVFVLTGGIALAVNYLQRINFGNNEALLIEENQSIGAIDFTDLGLVGGTYELVINKQQITDTQISDSDESTGLIAFSTKPSAESYSGIVEWNNVEDEHSLVREANLRSPITIAEPSFLPNDARLEAILIKCTQDGTPLPSTYMRYALESHGLLAIGRTYVGEDAEIQLTLTQPFAIEPIFVGDVEGVLVDWTQLMVDQTTELLQIRWVRDGFHYNVELAGTIPGGSVDRELLVAIAESVM